MMCINGLDGNICGSQNAGDSRRIQFLIDTDFSIGVYLITGQAKLLF
nr:hypothetical protein [uncultured Blautia sp.]